MAKKRSAAPPPAPEAPPQFGPAESAAALKKLYRRSPHITDAAEFVLHWADRTIEACPDPEQWQWGDLKPPTDRNFVASSRHWLAQAIAALDALNLPQETRQAVDAVIHPTFTIGRMLGNFEQALLARKNMKHARAEPMQKGRAKSTERAEDRRAEELKIIKKNKWSFDGKGLAKRLQGMLGVDENTGKLWSLTAIRADLKIYRRAITR